MRVAVRQFLALATLTALEALRQPVVLLLTAAVVVLTGAVPLLQMHVFGEDGRLARDSGLALHFLVGLLLAGSVSSATLRDELRRGTAAALLSKPVGRPLLFLAKYAGTAAVLLAFSCCATVATLLATRVSTQFVSTARELGYVQDTQTGVLLLLAPGVAFVGGGLMNYYRRRAFGSAAFLWLIFALVLTLFVSALFDLHGEWAPFDCRVDWRLLPVSLLVTLALLMLAACALALSTRFGAAPTLTGCLLLLVVGLLSDPLLGPRAGTSRLCAALYRLLPDWQHFWVCDALAKGGVVAWSYVGLAALYAALFTVGVLALGVLAFRRAEAV